MDAAYVCVYLYIHLISLYHKGWPIFKEILGGNDEKNGGASIGGGLCRFAVDIEFSQHKSSLSVCHLISGLSFGEKRHKMARCFAICPKSISAKILRKR